jgi:hypothetical protein
VVKNILATSGLALVIAVAVPFAAHAQGAQPNQPTATSGTSSQPPTGAATGTTDRQGQTGQPLEPSAGEPAGEPPPRGDIVGERERPQSDVDRNQQRSDQQTDREQPAADANAVAPDESHPSATHDAVGTSGDNASRPAARPTGTSGVTTASPDIQAQPAQREPPVPTAGSQRTTTAPPNERPTTAPPPRQDANQRVSQSDRPATPSGAADPSAASAARRALPNTASALPFIALGAIVAVALGIVIRLGANSID